MGKYNEAERKNHDPKGIVLNFFFIIIMLRFFSIPTRAILKL